ncbi:MAG: N2,N2-dimethylguanosine tRNA methyltransferase [Thermoplasmataceae archaeon]
MIIDEESARINVPDNFTRNGPGKKMPGFYNRTQKLNRDLSVLFVKSVKPEKSLDAFGGTGVRGIRLALETPTEVVITEQNPIAYKYVTENITLNNLTVKAYNCGFQDACNNEIFDYIDIDPYGTVVPYTDFAVNSVRPGGYIGFTATDLSPLTGSVIMKTRRRYGAFIQNDVFRHEMGLRLLISYIIKRAAVFDRAAYPLISFWNSHFYRLFFRIEKGTEKTDRLLDQIGTVNKSKLLWNKYRDIEEGPVWTGHLNDGDLIFSMTRDSKNMENRELRKYLDLMGSEDKSLLFWDLTRISQDKHVETPKVNSVVQKLNDLGIDAGRTEFSSTGIKARCKIEDIYSVF